MNKIVRVDDINSFSVVIPVYNEEGCLEELIQRTLKVCREVGMKFEILLVDDGSKDNSATIMSNASAANPGEIISVILNRNYGQHAAIMAGFSLVSGDLIITLDADLQNPPEEIPRLVAAAEEGKSLDEVLEIAQKFNSRIATLAVAMRGCTHPQNGLPITELGEDEMEIGMGQHGEGGGGRCKVLSADETAKIMFGDVSKALKLKTGEKIFVMANGVGATTPMELAIVFRAVKKLAEEIGVCVVGGIVDEILTVQEMAGFQLVACVVDEVSERYLYAKSDAPYWTCLGE